MTATDAQRTSCSTPPSGRFDEIVEKLFDRARTWPARTCQASEAATLPFAVGDRAGRGIILSKNLAIELGGAEHKAFSLAIPVSGAIDGHVTVIGPDVADLPLGTATSFAQILLVAGAEAPEDALELLDCMRIRDWVEGYQSRATPEGFHGKISRQLYSKGFGLRDLGSALASMVRSSCSWASAVEAIFIVGDNEAISDLSGIAREAEEAYRDLRRTLWAERGIDIDCPSGGHCGKCKDRATCASVKRIKGLRDKRTARRAL